MRWPRFYWGFAWPPGSDDQALLRFWGLDLLGITIGRWQHTKRGLRLVMEARGRAMQKAMDDDDAEREP